MTTKEAVALLERYSNYDGMGIPNLAGCKEAMRVAVDALKEACPELAESEDERIRRTLVEYFGPKVQLDFVRGIPIQKIRDWLEKQKEQKEIPLMGGDTDTYFDDLRITTKPLTSREWFDEGIKYAQRLQKEQKPAEWSDHDEKMRKALWNLLKIQYAQDYSMTAVGIEAGKFRNWLKSLRPSWRPSAQELGALKTAVSVLTEERTFPKAAEQIQKIINVFDGKELRKDWKPSEGQMEWLESAVRLSTNKPHIHGIIISLYEQLKRL